MTLKKPICFSYREYVELREAYEQLLEDNQKLMADNRRLRAELSEQITPRVAFVCDGRACGKDCYSSFCHHTQDVEHAVNFTKFGDKYIEEPGNND